MKIMPGKCCLGQRELVCCRSLGAVIQVGREDSTGISLSSRYKSQDQKLVSIMFIYTHNLFGRSCGIKQSLHFSFKIPYVGRLERTIKYT